MFSLDTHIFTHLTISVDVDTSHSDDNLWDALEQVGLKQAVNDMPDKLDTVIEDGGSLSRGQVRELLRFTQFSGTGDSPSFAVPVYRSN